jgi:autotransporter translocation and assembly factor TamB
VPTDEEVNKRQQQIAKLRDQAEDARLAAEAAQREQSNTITMAQLDAEEARLRAEIERNKDLANQKNIDAAVSAQVAQITGDVTEQYPKGTDVQIQADGTVQVLSVKADEAPTPPPAVTENTTPEPTPDPVPEPKS